MRDEMSLKKIFKVNQPTKINLVNGDAQSFSSFQTMEYRQKFALTFEMFLTDSFQFFLRGRWAGKLFFRKFERISRFSSHFRFSPAPCILAGGIGDLLGSEICFVVGPLS